MKKVLIIVGVIALIEGLRSILKARKKRETAPSDFFLAIILFVLAAVFYFVMLFSQFIMQP